MADVAKCPFCLEWVRAPGIDEPTWIQCPLCEAQYSSAELLEVQPPEVLVLPSWPAPEATWENEGGAVGRSAVDRTEAIVILPPDGPNEDSGPAHDSLREDADTFDPRPAGSGRIPSPFVTPEPAAAASRSRRMRARPGRRNSAKEFLKVVLGGIAGIVIAQLILWWLPGNLRRDPFRLATRLPVWLQWIRPPSWDAPTAATPRKQINSSDRARPDPFVDDLQRPAIPIVGPEEQREEIAIGPAGDVAPASAWIAIPDAGGSETARRAYYQDAPVYTGPELRQALAAVRSALQTYQASAAGNRPQGRDQQRLLYQRLCDVAQIVAYLDRNDAEIGPLMQAVEATLHRFTDDATLRRLVAQAAHSWLVFPARTSDGIALIGRVVQIRPLEPLFETELQLQDQAGSRVRILSPTDPSEDPREPYQVGDQLIVLGSILPSQPAADPESGNGWTIRSGFHTACEP